MISTRQADRPERLTDGYFARPDPQELLIDEIEAIWSAIAEREDWSAFDQKLVDLETIRTAYAL